jgi:Pre-toxin TG
MNRAPAKAVEEVARAGAAPSSLAQAPMRVREAPRPAAQPRPSSGLPGMGNAATVALARTLPIARPDRPPIAAALIAGNGALAADAAVSGAPALEPAPATGEKPPIALGREGEQVIGRSPMAGVGNTARDFSASPAASNVAVSVAQLAPARGIPSGPAGRTEGLSHAGREVIRREVAEVTADRRIQARQQPGGPTLLVPPVPPLSPSQHTAVLRKPPAATAASARTARQRDEAVPPTTSPQGANAAAPPSSPARGGAVVPDHRGPPSVAAARAHPAVRPPPPRARAAQDGGHRPSQGPRATGKREMAPGPAPMAGGRGVQLPDRPPTLSEFEAELQFPGDVPERRAHLGTLLEDLRRDAAGEKQGATREAAAVCAAITAGARADRQAVHALAAQHRSHIRGVFANAKVTLNASAARHRAQVTAAVGQDAAAARTNAATATEAATARGRSTKTALHTYATERRAEPTTIARDEGVRGARELEQAARECEGAGAAEAARHPGSEDPAPDQRHAAREVAARSAADIRAKKPALAQDLAERAAGFSGQYFEYYETVAVRIDEALAHLTTAIASARDEAVRVIHGTETGTQHAIEARHHADVAALGTAETASFAQLQHAEHTAVAQLERQAADARGHVQNALHALLAAIDAPVDEAAAAVGREDVPSIGGMTDLIERARAQVRAVSRAGVVQLGRLGQDSRTTLTATAAAFRSASAGIVHATSPATARIAAANSAAAARSLQARAQQGQTTLTGLRTRLERMAADLWVEIDRAAAQAREKMLSINTQFRTDIRKAADESIDSAKKPRTDQVETRVAEAAEQADESWVTGLFRAIGNIIVGLVILVVVALVVAAIAAAFGVILTAWGAIMIAGAILLAVGLVLAIINRAGQAELGGNPLAILGVAVLDVTGITGISEGVTGRDLVTNAKLSDADRTERGVLGVVSLVGIILGARAAVKGPPGGIVRPGSLRPGGFGEFFRGWVGFRESLPAGWRAARGVGVELYVGIRRAASNLREWIARRFGKRQAGPQPEVPEQLVSRPSIRQRLAEFYKRLGEAPRARTAEEGLRQVREILDHVEDDLSGIPKQNPPPPPNRSDGRMYPPLDDFTTRNPDGSITADTRGHVIDIDPTGGITIRSRATGNVEFQKSGR